MSHIAGKNSDGPEIVNTISNLILNRKDNNFSYLSIFRSRFLYRTETRLPVTSTKIDIQMFTIC